LSFDDTRRCAPPDLNHSWFPTHQEANFLNPNGTLTDTLSDGFVRVNDATEQLDNGVENPTDDQTMGFYSQDEIPFYYGLAATFAVNDRYFSSVLGPTFPNRSYFMAATSFGHLTTNDTFPPPGGYKPITGTIFDLLDKNKISWADYFQDAPQGGSFRLFGATGVDPHFLPLQVFLAQAEARQGHARTPDGISPGQCADLSNPPLSQQSGGGAECAQNPFSTSDTSVKDAESLCPAMAANPTGPYPEECASFDQLGLRVPFMAVSPFSKPHFLSHTVGDHTSLIAFIEKRFLSLYDSDESLHLTKRDQQEDIAEAL